MLTVVVDEEEPVTILIVLAMVSLAAPILIVFVPVDRADVPID